MTSQFTAVADATAAVPNDPAACHVCGRHAVGIGLEPQRKGEEPRWLCVQCVERVDNIKRVIRFDPYELAARRGGMEAAGALVDEFGSDLADWSEEQVLRFCGAIWKGCGDEMRRLIREGSAPF